ncbi:hypothetical protein MMC13_003339 [Lambiella insularis]|nr:hypothetical protein [Lambiella insularis]
MPAAKSKAELQSQKAKLASSYLELLEEFSSKELRTVGNYTLGKLIGKGSFGKVYLATHKLTNGSKVVLKSANRDDANLAREIHHHRQFLHPHIARLYEVIITESLVWLVLEYCPGDELYNYLLRHGKLPTNQVQKIFTQLVGAVSYVHNYSCVHRDLKLENILLDKNENVKLCDFGFTREYDGKTSHLQTFCGTVCYSAPEMLKGEKYQGEKVDVWSLGVILYALLTGELPFDDDDEMVTKHKILSSEPKYPETLPTEARALIAQLLSKRPILRPTLADILTNPFLANHAPAQQAILKVSQPSPFTTLVEKDTLQRMRSVGVDIDKVIENVLAQRCDPLAGWWALSIEKEERREIRRERKRKERELDMKTLRRISAASSILDRMAPPLPEVFEELYSPSITDKPRSRGRREQQSIPSRESHRSSPEGFLIPTAQIVLPELPHLPEGDIVNSPKSATPPPPIEKDSARSLSSSRHRPPIPPKDRRHSRSSALQLVSINPELSNNSNGFRKDRPRRRHPHPIMNHLASLKHWFVESAKRAKSPGTKSDASTLKTPQDKSPAEPRRSPANAGTRQASTATVSPKPPVHPPLNPHSHIKPHQRSSLSPTPLTPHSSYRRSSAGLRGRKSTSSSVSSVRSIHHVHTHSKASSTSSTSNSVKSTALNHRATRSPHTSVKVLPATPTTTTFPSNIRLVRTAPSAIATHYNESATFGVMPASPGLIFAKRKKTPFRGPMLNIGASNGASPARGRDTGTGSRSTSVPRRRSGELPQVGEEDEDEVEEVEAFSPVPDDGEETIVEGREEGTTGWVEYVGQ